MSELKARCSCGQLNAVCQSAPLHVFVCHCSECKLRTGSAFGYQALFNENQVQITGKSKSYTQIGDNGFRVSFNFCPNCGSQVWYRAERAEQLVGIPAGAFADADFQPPSKSIFESSKHPWVELIGVIE